MIRTITMAVAIGLMSNIVSAEERYDLVITGARVIDPETMLDQVRNIGISGNEIAIVTPEAISGADVIDASGLCLTSAPMGQFRLI